jgi:2-dehydro-3-deoxyphosphooctonate aldolase (KDO 8-P synthase)
MPDVISATAGAVTIGTGHALAFVIGPCVIESEAHAIETALELRDIAARVGVPLVFKASYDKANRTSLASFRGPGLDPG